MIRPLHASPSAASANHTAPHRAAAAVHAHGDPFEQGRRGQHRRRAHRAHPQRAPPAAGTRGCTPGCRGPHTSGCPTPGSPLRGRGWRGTPAPRGRACGDRRSATPPRRRPPSGGPRERAAHYPRRARARRRPGARAVRGPGGVATEVPIEGPSMACAHDQLRSEAPRGDSPEGTLWEDRLGARCATPPDPSLPRV